MNEYKDQSVWFEVLEMVTYGRWVVVSDHDTREQAKAEHRRLKAAEPGKTFGHRRRSGI